MGGRVAVIGQGGRGEGGSRGHPLRSRWGGCVYVSGPPYKFFAQKQSLPALNLTTRPPARTMLMRDCHSGALERSLVLARRDCSAGVCVARIPAYATLTYCLICLKLPSISSDLVRNAFDL